MLLLQFQAGNDRYGLEVDRIVEVIPMVAFRTLPHAEAAVAGCFNYRGGIVPVIDATVLLSGAPSRPLMSTRIILLEYGTPNGASRILGLLAEGVTETVSCTEAEFQPVGLSVPDAPYLGDVLVRPDGMIQRIEVEALLTDSLREALFPSTGDEAP
jgi:chemotaxis-related protein WspB